MIISDSLRAEALDNMPKNLFIRILLLGERRVFYEELERLTIPLSARMYRNSVVINTFPKSLLAWDWRSRKFDLDQLSGKIAALEEPSIAVKEQPLSDELEFIKYHINQKPFSVQAAGHATALFARYVDCGWDWSEFFGSLSFKHPSNRQLFLLSLRASRRSEEKMQKLWNMLDFQSELGLAIDDTNFRRNLLVNAAAESGYTLTSAKRAEQY